MTGNTPAILIIINKIAPVAGSKAKNMAQYQLNHVSDLSGSELVYHPMNLHLLPTLAIHMPHWICISESL